MENLLTMKNVIRMEKTINRTEKRAIPIIKLQEMARALIFASALLPVLASCVKDELYDTPHPEQGAIVVQMDWSGLLPEAVADNYILNVDGYEQTVSGTTNTLERLSEPGEHSFMAYNRPEGITLSGDIASVNEVTDTRAATANCEPLPDYLFSLSQTVNVVRDDTLRITAKPRQWVRQTNVTLTVDEGDYTRIATITGTFSGAERSVNIRQSERMGTAVSVSNGFTVAGSQCSTEFRLMGIVPTEKQTLTVHITFTNGETQTIESDLTEQMNGFNDGNEALSLTGNLHLPIEAGFTGSIEDWTVVDNGDIGIH